MKMHRNKKLIKMFVRFIWLVLPLMGTVDLWSQTTFLYDPNGNQISALYSGENACNNGPTNTEEVALSSNNRLEAYPNPFNNQLTLSLEIENTDNFDLVLYNVIGEVVAMPMRNEWLLKGIHIISLPPIETKGVLILRLSSKNNAISQKVLSW